MRRKGDLSTATKVAFVLLVIVLFLYIYFRFVSHTAVDYSNRERSVVDLFTDKLSRIFHGFGGEGWIKGRIGGKAKDLQCEHKFCVKPNGDGEVKEVDLVVPEYMSRKEIELYINEEEEKTIIFKRVAGESYRTYYKSEVDLGEYRDAIQEYYENPNVQLPYFIITGQIMTGKEYYTVYQPYRIIGYDCVSAGRDFIDRNTDPANPPPIEEVCGVGSDIYVDEDVDCGGKAEWLCVISLGGEHTTKKICCGLPPVAQFTYKREDKPEGIAITLDMSDSYDPDGEASDLSCKWILKNAYVDMPEHLCSLSCQWMGTKCLCPTYEYPYCDTPTWLFPKTGGSVTLIVTDKSGLKSEVTKTIS